MYLNRGLEYWKETAACIFWILNRNCCLYLFAILSIVCSFYLESVFFSFFALSWWEYDAKISNNRPQYSNNTITSPLIFLLWIVSSCQHYRFYLTNIKTKAKAKAWIYFTFDLKQELERQHTCVIGFSTFLINL